ncbi:MAG: MopE-related protein, partial [Myxococcales bacterium]|nr:MopE-related protein [Myxococcales bacterium]
VDEGLTRSCGSDLGACVSGIESCAAGSWGSCAGEIAPGAELCDGLLDEDCDGTVDEGCGCVSGTARGCGSDTGACRAGSQVCDASGNWGACAGDIGPSPEACNGIDDDCDGIIDEALTRSCGSDTGECVAGIESCAAGSWGTCAGEIGAGVEICDAARLDEDCDGLANEGCGCDEGQTRGCGSNAGACSPGVETCDASGSWGECVGSVGPSPEICDDIDNDCDRSRDEDLVRPCGTELGVCALGSQTCSRGSWGSCAGGVSPGLERCDGALDEDCDGAIDEGCACTEGMTRACGSGIGACISGLERCDLAGVWGSCVGSVSPGPETCNGLDDDCDGVVDEGVCATDPPIATCPGGMSGQVLSTLTLGGSGSDPDGGPVSYSWTVLSAPPGSTSAPSPPGAATTNFYLDAGGSFVVQLCVTDDEGDSSCCTVPLESTVPGQIHVELAWDQAEVDVDLHLRNVSWTSGEGWWTPDDCYYSNKTPDWGVAGASANPNLDIDDTDGFGPENTTIDVDPSAGTYAIALHYYCDDRAGTSTATGATVRIWCDGALVATYPAIDLGSTDAWITLAELDYPSCAVRAVNASRWGNQTLPPGSTWARHCTIPCSRNNECPGNERCVSGSCSL